MGRVLRSSFCGLALLWEAEAQLRMMAPSSLVSQFAATHGRIEGSTSTFGAPFYGERLLGRAVWGESKTGHSHCKDDDYEVEAPPVAPGSGSERGEAQPLHVVIVRRGLCSFVTKVRVAEKKGAHAVIIVDREDSTLSPWDIRRTIVADDGYGDTVTIPSMLVSNREGQYLIDTAKAGNEVIVELAWDVPPDDVVLVDQWLSSGSRESFRFLKDFAEKRKALNDVVKFVPHYYVFGMKSTMDQYNELCSSSSGDFCTEDPDGAGPVTGRMVLEEDVRQLCIHELYRVPMQQRAGSKQVEYAREYWDYVAKFLDECPIDGQLVGHRFGKTCSDRVMQQAGIDSGRVAACAEATKDAKLKDQRENVAWSPRALRINGWRYSGVMDADLVTRAICAGFTTKPEACSSLTAPMHPVLERITRIESSGLSVGSLALALCVVSVLGMAVLFFYRRSLKLQMRRTLKEEVLLEVQAQLGAYNQMSA